jgi:iron complex transport system substrate-binding protein
MPGALPFRRERKMKKLVLVATLASVLTCFSQGELLSTQFKRQRIISLAPSTTEILFGLSLDDEIVGITIFCNYPPEALKKEKIGTFSQPNIEKILSLKPDVIFATGLEQAPAVERLRQLKLKVYVSDPSNIEELFNSIKEIGKLTYREIEAERLIALMKTEIEKIRAQVKLTPPNKRPKVFIEIWHDPLMTAGRGSFINELITLAGGINIAQDISTAYSYFNLEQLIDRNPDLILLAYRDNKEAQDIVKNRFGWEGIKAVKNDRVYNDINPDLFLRPGPRLVEGLKEIHKRLHPE